MTWAMWLLSVLRSALISTMICSAMIKSGIIAKQYSALILIIYTKRLLWFARQSSFYKPGFKIVLVGILTVSWPQMAMGGHCATNNFVCQMGIWRLLSFTCHSLILPSAGGLRIYYPVPYAASTSNDGIKAESHQFNDNPLNQLPSSADSDPPNQLLANPFNQLPSSADSDPPNQLLANPFNQLP